MQKSNLKKKVNKRALNFSKTKITLNLKNKKKISLMKIKSIKMIKLKARK